MDRSIIGGNPAAEKMRSTGRTRRPYKMTAAKLRLAMASMGQKETKVGELSPSWASPARRSTGMLDRMDRSGQTERNCWVVASRPP